MLPRGQPPNDLTRTPITHGQVRQVLKQNLLFNNHLIPFLPVTFKQPASDSLSYPTPM